jgi:hypothetical protein
MSAMRKDFQKSGFVPPHRRIAKIVLRVLNADEETRLEMSRGLSAENQTQVYERLIDMAVAALSENPGSWKSAVEALLAECRKDPELLWYLFEPFHHRAAERALNQAADIMRRNKKTEASKAPAALAVVRDTGSRGGASSSPRDGGMGRAVFDDQKINAHPAPSSSRANQLRAQADKDAATVSARADQQIRLSKLDTFPLINGQKLGDVTPREALAWAASRHRDARFVEMLCENLPPDRPIRHMVTGATADELYERAQAEVASA